MWLQFDSADGRPLVEQPSAGVAGLVLRLSFRYGLLAFETVYLAWAFDDWQQMPMTPLRARGDAQFWWSQYLWLAALPAAAHVVDALMQLYPRVTTVACVAAGNETLLGTALRVLVPISRLYVGKQVHEPFSAVLRYFGFWGSLVLFKLAFGYLYVVRPMVTPSIALYDDE